MKDRHRGRQTQRKTDNERQTQRQTDTEEDRQ